MYILFIDNCTDDVGEHYSCICALFIIMAVSGHRLLMYTLFIDYEVVGSPEYVITAAVCDDQGLVDIRRR